MVIYTQIELKTIWKRKFLLIVPNLEKFEKLLGDVQKQRNQIFYINNLTQKGHLDRLYPVGEFSLIEEMPKILPKKLHIYIYIF